MSFKANMTVDGKDFELLECICELHQKSDSNGRPASGVNGGQIRFVIEGTDDDTFGAWITDPAKTKNGKIIFYRIDQDSKFKEIEFTNAYLSELHESFITDNGIEMFHPDDINFKNSDRQDLYNVVEKYQTRSRMSYVVLGLITAEKVKIDGVEHNSRW